MSACAFISFVRRLFVALIWARLVHCVADFVLFSNANNSDEMFAHSDGFIINAISSSSSLYAFRRECYARERSCG